MSGLYMSGFPTPLSTVPSGPDIWIVLMMSTMVPIGRLQKQLSMTLNFQ